MISSKVVVCSNKKAKALYLIHPVRSDQIKFGDFDIENGVIHQAHHLVFAFHAAHVGF